MTKALPPYPRFGECIAALAGALNITANGSDVGRLARDGDFDWERLNAVLSELLVEGSARVIGAAAHRLIAPWLSTVRDGYTRLVLDVPLDALDRSDALPILVEDFFAPAAASLLQRANSAMPGPNLLQFLDDGRAPVDVTLAWLDGLVKAPIEKALYPESTGTDRVDQEKVRKWRAGVDVPSSQSIKLLCQRLQNLQGNAEQASAAALWLTLATALTRFERAWGASLGPLVAKYLETNHPGKSSVRTRLLTSVQHIGGACPELTEAGGKLWHDLMRTTTKKPGDQARTWREIESLEAQVRANDPQIRTAYHYAWMRGRWYVLSGQYQEALPHYERAFELACYRAGRQIKDLISEASCVAAFLEKRVFLKRLKHVGIALGLFRKPDTTSVLDDWEFSQFAQQLPIRFPVQGRFVECEALLSAEPMPGMLAISKADIANIKPDLKTLDRVRAVHFANGDVRRWPQLRLFASFGMVEQVKTLLEAGAPVDDLDSSGASALLCALQHAEATGEREVLDLLLAQPHQATTLNASTHRKRLTPLMCAIDLGMPDVVEALLNQKADVEKRALTDGQSPLYYLVTQLFYKINPNRALLALTAKLLEEPDLVVQDTLRRFGVGLAGTFGAETQHMRSCPDLAATTADLMLKHHGARHSSNKLMEIASLLLQAGANPNAVHRYPVAGRTPLMLAAESDLPELFDLMIRHGGDPLQPDADRQDCWRLAMSFGSRRVLDYLQRMTP